MHEKQFAEIHLYTSSKVNQVGLGPLHVGCTLYIAIPRALVCVWGGGEGGADWSIKHILNGQVPVRGCSANPVLTVVFMA